jgi:hypothetical protein
VKHARTAIALEPFQGGWQAGVDIYKSWRSSWMKLPPVPEWAKEPHAWLQIHINSPEDMLPEVPLMTAVTGFDDRNMINQCLMYRYIISYEPYNFKGKLSDYPLTVAYGQQMDALRTELRDYFWDGEFRHEVGATVTKDGRPHHPYSVFINHQNGKPGVVVCNYDLERTITAEVRLDGGAVLERYRLVDDTTWHAVSDGIVLPPRPAAVIVS